LIPAKTKTKRLAKAFDDTSSNAFAACLGKVFVQSLCGRQAIRQAIKLWGRLWARQAVRQEN